jgi:hypothetical protein
MPHHKLLPAPGYTYEGIHGASNGPQMLVATGITLGFAVIAVTLRMVVRWFIVPPTSKEDYFAIASLVLAIARTILLILRKY